MTGRLARVVAPLATAIVLFAILRIVTEANLLLCGAAALFVALAVIQGRYVFARQRATRNQEVTVEPTTKQSKIATIASVFIGLWAIWTVGNLLVNPYYADDRYSKVILIVLVVGIVLILPTIVAACMAIGAWFDGRSSRWKVATGVIVVVAIFAIQLGLAYTVFRPSGFDSDVIIQSAASLADGSRNSYGLTSDYFAVYPTNIFILMILWKLFSALRAFGITDSNGLLWGAVILNVICLQVSLVFTFLAARRMSRTGTAIIIWLVAAAFVLISPWISVPYTDILGMPFPPIVLFLYLVLRTNQRTSRKIVGWVLIGAVLGIGYNIKPTIVFVVVAVLVVALLSDGFRLWIRPSREPRVGTVGRVLRSPIAQRVLVVVLVGIAFAGVSTTIKTAENHSGVFAFDMTHDEQAFPATHFLMMGAAGDGGYSKADVLRTMSIPTESGKFTFGLQQYFARVAEMGPDGYAEFLGKKALLTSTDGTFSQWLEGGLLDHPFVHSDALSHLVQSYWAPDGSNRQSLVLAWQSLWVVALLGMAVPLRRRWRGSFEGQGVTVARITVTLLVIYLLFFEGRARYLYLFVPMFAIVAGVGIEAAARRGRALLRDTSEPLLDTPRIR